MLLSFDTHDILLFIQLWQSGALKLPLSAGSKKESNHKGLLYAIFLYISTKKLFSQLKHVTGGHIIIALSVISMLPSIMDQSFECGMGFLSAYENNIIVMR